MRRFSVYFILASLLSVAVLAQDTNMSGADNQAPSPTGDENASSPDSGGGSSAPSPTSGDESSGGDSAPTTTDENAEQTTGDESSGDDNTPTSENNAGGGDGGNEYGAGGDYGGSADNNEYGGSADNNDYGGSADNNDYGGSADNNDYGGSADNNDYGGGGSGDYEGPMVTPYVETVIQDVVNTVVEYNTVYVQHTQVHPTVEQVTSINVANVAASQDAIYQVTQTYVCPLPPTVTVDQLNTIWITETYTPTVQVYQTRVNPQVVNQAVTITEEIEQVDVQTQVINLDATAVVTTNMNNMVQVVQQDVPRAPVETPAPPQAILPNAGAADDGGDPGNMIPNAGAADDGGDGNGDMIPDAGAANENDGGSGNGNGNGNGNGHGGGNGGGHYAHPTHAVYTSKAPTSASNYKHRKAVKTH